MKTFVHLLILAGVGLAMFLMIIMGILQHEQLKEPVITKEKIDFNIGESYGRAEYTMEKNTIRVYHIRAGVLETREKTIFMAKCSEMLTDGRKWDQFQNFGRVSRRPTRLQIAIKGCEKAMTLKNKT